MLLSYSNFFRFCNAAAAAILDFQKFEILTGFIQCVIAPNFVKIRETVAEISQFNGFSRWWQPPYWICRMLI